MEFYSELLKQDYCAEEAIFLDNELQSKRYISYHIMPIDIIPSNKKEDAVVHVFRRSDTKEVYKRWKAYDLPWNTNEK